MNIFVLDTDPVKCAQSHCDKHVVKMVLETAQLLSTVMPDKCKKDTAVESYRECYRVEKNICCTTLSVKPLSGQKGWQSKSDSLFLLCSFGK